MPSSEELADLIQQRLSFAYPEATFHLIDETLSHQKHLHFQAGKGHFILEVICPAWQDLSLIVIHRRIYKALDDLMKKRIHALSIQYLNQPCGK